MYEHTYQFSNSDTFSFKSIFCFTVLLIPIHFECVPQNSNSIKTNRISQLEKKRVEKIKKRNKNWERKIIN